jgi:uncharacterized protein (DUF302 family)
MKMGIKMAVTCLVAVLMVVLASTGAFAAKAEQGAYVKLFSGMKADIGKTTETIKTALTDAGFEVIASYENGVPEGCNFRAMTVVFTNGDYSSKVLAGGQDKAFGLPHRIGVYEDESGLNVAVVNPIHMNRTFYLNNSKDADAEAELGKIMDALKGVGNMVMVQAGQIRTEGEIGGMGGGRFPDKLIAAATSGKSVADAAKALADGISDKAAWHSVYTYQPNEKVAVVGITNTAATEGRAFSIAGDKRSGKNYKFPGLDHAAAFPVEVVVYESGGKTTAHIVVEMWRMKLYFEDAGTWAFMKNMAMPGDIEDEITAAVKAALK